MMFIPNQYYYPYYTYNTFTPIYQINQIKSLHGDTMQRSRFTKEEDELLKQLADSQESPNWNSIACHMKNRTGRQCRERYNNYLRPNLVNGTWTHEEDELLLTLYEKYGPKWSLISQSFKSRSPVNIKNHHSSLVNQSVVKIRINRINGNTNEQQKMLENKEDLLKIKVEANAVKLESKPSSQEKGKNDHFYFEFNNEDLWSNNLAPTLSNDLLAF